MKRKSPIFAAPFAFAYQILEFDVGVLLYCQLGVRNGLAQVSIQVADHLEMPKLRCLIEIEEEEEK